MAELADAVGAGSPEPVKAGRYTFVHARWWGEDSSYSDKTGSTQTMSTYESKRYRAADGSGRDYVIAIPGESTRADEVSHYGRGGLAGVLPEPIPTSPSVLAAQLAVHAGPPEDQPRGLMRAAADLYRLHLLERDARVAVLRMLAAHTPPVECAGTVLDRAGRTGIAVAVTFGISRYTLVFDPATGGLLADEQMLLRNPPALSGPVPRVISYWLFLAADRTDQLPA